jgi:hypothetical protein
VNTVAWHGYGNSGNDGQRESEISGRGDALTEGGDDFKAADYLTQVEQVGRDVQRHFGERAAEHHHMECGAG